MTALERFLARQRELEQGPAREFLAALDTCTVTLSTMLTRPDAGARVLKAPWIEGRRFIERVQNALTFLDDIPSASRIRGLIMSRSSFFKRRISSLMRLRIGTLKSGACPCSTI